MRTYLPRQHISIHLMCLLILYFEECWAVIAFGSKLRHTGQMEQSSIKGIIFACLRIISLFTAQKKSSRYLRRIVVLLHLSCQSQTMLPLPVFILAISMKTGKVFNMSIYLNDPFQPPGGNMPFLYLLSHINCTHGRSCLLKNLYSIFISRASLCFLRSIIPRPTLCLCLHAKCQATWGGLVALMSTSLQRQCFLYLSICFTTEMRILRVHK